jgi:hypothetical protein
MQGTHDARGAAHDLAHATAFCLAIFSQSRAADIDPHMLTSLQKHAQESNLLDTYTSGLFGPKMSHLTRTRERVQSPASLSRVAGWPRERTGRWPRAAAHEWRDLLTRGFPSPAGVLDRFDTLGPGCLRAPPGQRDLLVPQGLLGLGGSGRLSLSERSAPPSALGRPPHEALLATFEAKLGELLHSPATPREAWWLALQAAPPPPSPSPFAPSASLVRRQPLSSCAQPAVAPARVRVCSPSPRRGAVCARCSLLAASS